MVIATPWRGRIGMLLAPRPIEAGMPADPPVVGLTGKNSVPSPMTVHPEQGADPLNLGPVPTRTTTLQSSVEWIPIRAALSELSVRLLSSEPESHLNGIGSKPHRVLESRDSFMEIVRQRIEIDLIGHVEYAS